MASARLVVTARELGGSWVYIDTAVLGADGHFEITTDALQNMKELDLTVYFDQQYLGAVSNYKLGVGPGTGSYYTPTYVSITNLASGEVDVGQIDLNPDGDTTTLNGDVAAAWASIIDADRRLALDGETTQRVASTTFRILDIDQVQDCSKGSAFEEFIAPGEARSKAPAKAMGLALLARVVGCNPTNAWPMFPVADVNAQAAFNDHRFDSDTGEGVALVEAIPELVALLTWWDPATATWAGMKATHDYKCMQNSPTEGYCSRGQWVVTGTSGKSNSNNLSSYRNDAYALWNLLDTSSADTFYCQADTVDLTVHDLMLALQAFQAGPQGGGSGDANEMSLINPYGNCSSGGSAVCGVGDVCGGASYACYTGDPHGSNLRDWLRYLPSGEAAAVSAITSQECVGVEDHAYPFRGGYRGD